MANYVTNYVFCNESLYNDFLNVPFDQRLFQEGMYDPVGCILEDDRRLVVFDTRGMDYKHEQIERIINKYHDIVWNCVEENLVEEGQFCWDGEKVTLTMRPLQEAVGKCFLTIYFFNPDNLRFESIMGFPDKIIEENYVTNTRREYYLSEYASDQIMTYINQLRTRLLREADHGELPSVIDGDILDEYYFWNADNYEEHAGIWKCDDDRATQEELKKGEQVIKEVRMFLESLFKEFGIDIQLSYKEIKEFAIRNNM